MNNSLALQKNKEGFFPTLIAISVPIMLQSMLQTFINMLDTIMVGQLGSIEIAAVGLGNQVFFVLNMILFGITSGGGVFIAQYWGKKDIEKIHKTTGMMLQLSFLFTFLFAMVSILFPQK